MVRLTEPEGSVVRPNLADPPSSADTDTDADSSVVHYLSVTSISYQKGHKSVEECIIKWMSTNDICKQCSPIFFSFNDKRPSCQSNEDIKCWHSWSWTQENYISYKRCMKPMKITLYKAKPLALDYPFIQNHTVGLDFAYTTDEIKIEEETLMIGTSS